MRITLLFLALLTMAIIGCSDISTDSDLGQGRLVIQTFDGPGPDSVDAILLHVIEVSVHHVEDGWSTVAEPDTIINFLDLVNGVMLGLVDDSVAVGDYDQLRLLLADTNVVVINGDSLDLTTPSAHTSGLKLNAVFTVEDDELVTLFVDFDASTAITTAADMHILHPTFKVFREELSGRLSGNVSDETGAGIAGCAVGAASATHTTATITDENGDYLLILPDGTYNLIAAAMGYIPDFTTHTGIVVTAGMSEMSNVDFVLSH